ncbi:MAG TPA: CDP-alcohol phosphatidyltransferase family protein [Thermomicrobiaceae bacterium]|nr:CDP-alcohol phosphatidyltransferase family protein [Thermomicrobiaceae bacterium]
MFSALWGNWVRGHLQGVGLALGRTNLSPNWFTIVGLFLNVVVAAVIASGNLTLGGVLMLGAGAFDMLDGAVARATKQITRFGGFLDSTLDRYSEAAIYFGLLVYFERETTNHTAVLLIYAAAIGSLMVSYARARAEAGGLRAEVGLFARPERVVLLSVFLLLQRPFWAVAILALLTNATALQRIVHVWRITRGPEQR